MNNVFSADAYCRAVADYDRTWRVCGGINAHGNSFGLLFSTLRHFLAQENGRGEENRSTISWVAAKTTGAVILVLQPFR